MKPYSFITTTLCVLALSGCSNISPQEAIKLSQEGVKFSTAASSYYQDTRLGLNEYVEATSLDDALKGHDAINNAKLKDINSAAEGLLAREKIFNSLSKTYTSLGNLASFDSATETQKNIITLEQSIESYRQHVNGAPPSKNDKPEILTAHIGGLLVSEQQKNQLEAASKLIRENLQEFKKLLALDHDVLLSIQRVVIDAKSDAAKSLIANGLGDPEPLVISQLAAFGLNSKKATEADWIAEIRKTYISQLNAYKEAIKKNPTTPPSMPEPPPIYKSLLKITDARAATEKSTQEALFTEIEKSIDALTNMHLQFERGTPITIASLTDRLVKLRELLDQLKTSKAANENPKKE